MVSLVRAIQLEFLAMSMIFPGMDPYLEDAQIWEGFQARLIVYISDALQPQIRPRYIASVERRVPGLEVHQSFLEILDTATGMRVVTVIEVVSPSNKFHGHGRELYLTKQAEVLSSPVHLVEIDLHRTGPHVLSVPEHVVQSKGPYDYLVCINRASGARAKFELYPRRLPERLPRIPIPLASGDRDAVLDVQAVLELTYDRGAYRDQLRYDRSCSPPLEPTEDAWARDLISRTVQGSIQ